MGSILTNGVFLPAEGERNCYEGLAANWTALDRLIGGYNVHISNTTIHVTAADKQAWNGKADASALTAHTGDTTIHVTAEDKAKWDAVTGKADASALTAHTGDTTIHVTAKDKAKWDAVTSKADDSAVVHKSGNETVAGVKTFSDNPVIGSNSSNTTISNKQIIGYSTASTTGKHAYSFMQLKAIVNYTDSSSPIDVTVGLEINEDAFADGKRSAFFPISNNITSLGKPGKRWANVYATNYYYGGSEVEFSTKFVTTDTNQTIGGQKTFNSNTYIYNSDVTATTPNLYLRSSKIEISSQGNTSGDQNLVYLDKNNTNYAYVKGAIQSNGTVVKIRALAKDSSNNSVINELQILALTNGNKAIFPSYSNEIDLGLSNYKWKSFNGVEPSSLSLPSDRSAHIDISGYFTNTGTEQSNSYTVPANGYIYLTLSELTNVHCFSRTSGNITNYAQTFTKLSNSQGVLYVLFPVRKNDVFVATWYTTTTVSVDSAFFIPCKGNI